MFLNSDDPFIKKDHLAAAIHQQCINGNKPVAPCNMQHVEVKPATCKILSTIQKFNITPAATNHDHYINDILTCSPNTIFSFSKNDSPVAVFGWFKEGPEVFTKSNQTRVLCELPNYLLTGIPKNVYSINATSHFNGSIPYLTVNDKDIVFANAKCSPLSELFIAGALNLKQGHVSNDIWEFHNLDKKQPPSHIINKSVLEVSSKLLFAKQLTSFNHNNKKLSEDCDRLSLPSKQEQPSERNGTSDERSPNHSKLNLNSGDSSASLSGKQERPPNRSKKANSTSNGQLPNCTKEKPDFTSGDSSAFSPGKQERPPNRSKKKANSTPNGLPLNCTPDCTSGDSSASLPVKHDQPPNRNKKKANSTPNGLPLNCTPDCTSGDSSASLPGKQERPPNHSKKANSTSNGQLPNCTEEKPDFTSGDSSASLPGKQKRPPNRSKKKANSTSNGQLPNCTKEKPDFTSGDSTASSPVKQDQPPNHSKKANSTSNGQPLNCTPDFTSGDSSASLPGKQDQPPNCSKRRQIPL